MLTEISQASEVETPPTSNRPKVIFLDVNETLLDLAPLTESVGKALGGRKELLPLWFSMMVHHSLVDTVTGKYHGFGEIGVASLMMLAEINKVQLTQAEAEAAILPVMTKLPPHPDVIVGLTTLKEEGYLLVTLTNSSNSGVKAQLENAGLINLVDRRLSIEDIQVYKPDLRAYRWALQQVGVEAKDALLVAAHGWDIAGAKAAGLQTAFIARPGKVLYPLAAPPDYRANDLIDLAKQLATNK